MSGLLSFLGLIGAYKVAFLGFKYGEQRRYIPDLQGTSLTISALCRLTLSGADRLAELRVSNLDGLSMCSKEVRKQVAIYLSMKSLLKSSRLNPG